MTIAEVSKKYDISPDTLRYYERIGLIPPVPRSKSGIRDYGEESCGWIELMKCMRAAGVQIEALIEYVALFQQGDDTIDARKAILIEQRDQLMERMAESAKATVDYFGKHIVFLNVMRRMSVDCDCAGVSAAEPTIPDIGILASTDILAIDQACIDLVYAQPEKYRHDLVERIESRHGLHQLTAMREMKMGNPQYELISID